MDDVNFGVCSSTECEEGYLVDQCGECLIPGVDSISWDQCVGCDGEPHSGLFSNFCGLCVDPENPVECPGKACNGRYDSTYTFDACDACTDSALSTFITDVNDCLPAPPVQVIPKVLCWDSAPGPAGEEARYVAIFSYDNPGETVTLRRGASHQNYFALKEDRLQTQLFPAGPGPVFGAFGTTVIVWRGEEETWTIGSRSVSIALKTEADREQLADYRCPADFNANFLSSGPGDDADAADDELAKRYTLAASALKGGLKLSDLITLIRRLIALFARIRLERVNFSMSSLPKADNAPVKKKVEYKMKLNILPSKDRLKSSGPGIPSPPTNSTTKAKRQSVLEEAVAMSAAQAADIVLNPDELTRLLATVGLEPSLEAGAIYEPLAGVLGASNQSPAIKVSPSLFMMTIACVSLLVGMVLH
eukprot:TRINITY_DN11270_c0_g1_i1.p1 TRINITY_DN11270_c0_g1~~TRINITY_DN11270_c0_g1_i1.p1  ORF type:complete len:471 (+),score=82.84 TRINITY_DN11270_c0_g1_i1:159-1415(+)